MKKLCSSKAVVELFIQGCKPSKRDVGGERTKSAALLACAGRSGWEKFVVRFGRQESKLANLIRLKRIRFIHGLSGYM